MNCGFSDIFCCIRPMPSVSLTVSRIVYNNSNPYADVFIQVDKTYILDSDYLVVAKPGQLPSNQKILITKEPGDLSGVSRVTFPDDCETNIISYIRCTANKKSVLGECIVSVVPEQRECISTDYTEEYSPMFRPSLTKKFMMS